MQIQSNSQPQTFQTRPARPQPSSEQPKETFDNRGDEGPGLMPNPLNYSQAGAIYGGIAGTGIAVALGCMTFGVGLMAGFATVPLGVAIGSGAGALMDMMRS